MASDEKTFTALGKDWTARFDFNAVCALEDRYDRPFLELVSPFMASVEVGDDASAIAAASRIKFSDLRAILHQSLLRHHPGVTLDDVGEIVSDIGLDNAMPIVAWAIMSAMPAPKVEAGNARKK